MKGVLAVLLACLIVLPLAARAAEEGNAALAEELLMLMQVDKAMQQAFDMMKQMHAAQAARRESPQDDAASGLPQAIMDLVSSELTWARLKDDYVNLYADMFTEEELQGIIEFYKSPVGVKFVEKQPELARRSMELSQKQMLELQPKIDHLIEESRQAAPPPPTTE